MRTASTLLGKMQGEGIKEGHMKLEGADLEKAVKALGLTGKILGSYRFSVTWEVKDGEKGQAYLDITAL
jgi:hypothetical protein